jgi:hypothetical protein
LNKIFSFFFIFIFIGCSKEAPNLPNDYSSINKKEVLNSDNFNKELLELSCDDIKLQVVELNKIIDLNINEINSTRTENQTLGYFSLVIFPPLWFAINNHESEKDKIEEVYKQKDLLFKLESFKQCTP